MERPGWGITRWLLLVALLFVAALHRGHTAATRPPTTFYVNSREGDDANRGNSPQLPWRTLERVNTSVFIPGDRILFHAGTSYKGRLDLRSSGTEEKPILVGVDRFGPKPRIDAEGRFPEAIRLHNVQGVEISDLEITNTGPERAPRRFGVNITLEDFGTAQHIVLRDLYIHDVNSSNVKGEGGAGISWGNGGEKTKSRFDGLLIENCRLERTDRNGIVGWSDYWPRSKWYPNLNVVIRSNELTDIGGDGIVPIGCDGCVVEHNTLRRGRARAQDYAAGIWPWSCDNTVIQCNEVSGMVGTLDGQGFDADWNCRNTIIQYNYSHDNEGGFVLICNDGTQGAPDNAGNQRPIVRYNISQNDGARIFQISAVKDALIYNNTIYVGKGRDVAGAFFHDWGGWAENTLFANNIFYADGAIRWDPGESRGTRFDHNLLYGNHYDRPEDPKALSRNPQLSAPGRGGDDLLSRSAYTLRPASPCLRAGVAIGHNGGRDFFGNRVPDHGAVDIGAYQLSR